MSIEIVTIVEADLEEFEIEERRFKLEFAFTPSLPIGREGYDYLGIDLYDRSGTDKDMLKMIDDWSINYMDKLGELQFAILDSKWEVLEYTNMTLNDIKEENNKQSIIKEMKKKLIERNI